MNRTTQSIERSHRIATETDQIGSEIIEELGEQRDQLERTKNRVSLVPRQNGREFHSRDVREQTEGARSLGRCRLRRDPRNVAY